MSLFDRILNSFDKKIECPVFRLTVQYRMDPEICRWPSKFFYEDRLTSDPLMHDDAFPIKPYTVVSLDFHQTERTNATGTHSLSNIEEAEFVTLVVRTLAKIIPDNKYSIGIISPYAQQKEQLMKQLQCVPH